MLTSKSEVSRANSVAVSGYAYSALPGYAGFDET
jgi:hypothetical protein